MYNRRFFSPRAILLIVYTMLFIVPCSFAQNSYKEIEVYRSLLHKEARDSSYHKALTKHGTKKPKLVASTPLQQQFVALAFMPENSDASVIQKREALLALAQEAAAQKERETELTALSKAFTMAFWQEPKNYSKAFDLGILLKNKLDEVDDKQFAGRRNAYVKLGEAYYIFKDYATSVKLLKNVIHTTPLSFWDLSHLEALRISGICYANMPGMMMRSDSCFMAMMLCNDRVFNRPVYDALALSNLGCNALIQGKFDKALALDLEVLPRLKQEKDYGHIAGMYSCQGFSHFGKGDYRSLSKVIDSISAYAHKDYYNRNKRLKQAYTLNANYYSVIGDARTAQLYNDSLVAIYKAEESEYSSQFISNARQKVKDEKIRLSAEQVEHQRHLIAFFLISLMVVSIGMAIILQLYRKRNAAYKALARKATEWAHENIPPTTEPITYAEPSEDALLSAEDTENRHILKEQPTEEDLHIMSLLEQKIVAVSAYREQNLTLNDLASQLGVRRHTLSRAINRVAGVNFYQYINSYRIKEAVRLISQKSHDELHINEVYDRIGFTNRTTFYRAFKQFTGLSPLDFQKNNESNKKK